MKKQFTFVPAANPPSETIHIKAFQRFLAIMLFLFYWSASAFAQTGKIAGKLEDENGEGLPFARVTLLDSLCVNTINIDTTDIDGNYAFENLLEKKYSLKFEYMGYTSQITKGAIVANNLTKWLHVKLNPIANTMNEVMVLCYRAPIVSKSCTTVSTTTDKKDINRLQTSNITNISSKTAGVYQENENSGVTIRGSRSEAVQYIVNGRPVLGNPHLPVNASNQQYITMGGVPARYENAEQMGTDQFNTKIDNTRISPAKRRIIPTQEEYNPIVENEFLLTSIAPRSTFSIDVDAASYSIIRKKLNAGEYIPSSAVRLEEMINYFPYNYKEATQAQPFSVQTEMSTCPWDASHVLLKIGIQGKKIETNHLPSSNLVFLVDVSGSMESPDKLPMVQKSLQLLVEQLQQEDQVALVVYAGNAGLVLPSTPAVNKRKILDAIDALRAGGSTAGGAGIQLAYKTALANFKKGGNNRLILCTDGDFNVGASSESELVTLIEEKRKTGVFLSVFGFGMGNYKDGKMEQLADKGNGNYAYIDNEKEARKNMVLQMAANFLTIAKDVKIQTVFNPVAVKSYRLIGYENRKLQDHDFSNDTIDAGEIGAGANVTALYELVLSNERAVAKVNLADSLQQPEMMELSSNDLMALRIRYKKPDENKSNLIEERIGFNSLKLSETSNDFRFAASVACFGMLLRHSKFSGNATWKSVEKLAKGSIGKDSDGFREEMLELITLAAQQDTNSASR